MINNPFAIKGYSCDGQLLVRHRFVSATTDVKEIKTQLFCYRMAGITCSRELLLFSHFAQSCQKIED